MTACGAPATAARHTITWKPSLSTHSCSVHHSHLRLQADHLRLCAVGRLGFLPYFAFFVGFARNYVPLWVFRRGKHRGGRIVAALFVTGGACLGRHVGTPRLSIYFVFHPNQLVGGGGTIIDAGGETGDRNGESTWMHAGD